LQLELLQDLCAEYDACIPNDARRRAGEQYVRALFVASGDYRDVSQTQRLGALRDNGGKNAADLFVTDSAGRRFAVSVKNQREFLFPGKGAISDCFVKAKAHDAEPWLFAAFAVPEVLDACRSRGVRLSVFGRQILPARDRKGQHTSWLVNRLFPILGPLPFETAYLRFSRTIERSEFTRSVLLGLRGAA
jgi:hypothetical protein